MKKCSNCFQSKPLSEFYVKRSPGYRNGVGYQSRCKTCNAEVVRGYALRKRRHLIAERWQKIREATS
jgi:hypothetical protein